MSAPGDAYFLVERVDGLTCRPRGGRRDPYHLVADEVPATDHAAGAPTWADAEAFDDESLGLTFWIRKASPAAVVMRK